MNQSKESVITSETSGKFKSLLTLLLDVEIGNLHILPKFSLKLVVCGKEMTEQQQNCLSDGEEDPDDNQIAIDHPIICHNDADVRKSLFDEFDVPAKQRTSSDSSGREYMKVYLRVRPFSDREIEGNENQQCVEKESRTTVLMNAPKESFAFKNSTRAGGEISHRFSFTNVFGEETTQKSFFDETTLPLVTDFIHGQNCLVFTYGVTNSGKVSFRDIESLASKLHLKLLGIKSSDIN